LILALLIQRHALHVLSARGHRAAAGRKNGRGDQQPACAARAASAQISGKTGEGTTSEHEESLLLSGNKPWAAKLPWAMKSAPTW
jgi:hypothetical protein